MGSAGTRMSTAEMLNNIYENFMFNMGSNIAGNTMLYSLYKTGDILDTLFDDTSLGIELIGKVETSLSDIFKLMSLGGSVLDFVGQLMGGAKLGAGSTLGDVFNSLGGLTKGSTYLSSGVGLSGTGSSESGTYGNMSTSNLLQSSLGGMRNELEQNRQAITGRSTDEDDINVVVPNIYKYLINTFDGKLDTLIKLSAVNSNYSVVDTLGNNITNSMKTIMGGNSVVVQANAVEKEDLTVTISESVVGIYDILNKVVNGELQLAVRDITTPIGFAMNAGNMAYNTWTGAMR